MKHFRILLFFAMTATLSAADPAPDGAAAVPAVAASAEAAPVVAKPAAGAPAAIPAERPSVSVLSLVYQSYPEPSAYADPERAETLLKRRAELIQQIHNERKRLLEEDATAKKLREEIVQLNRKLASHLEDKRSMIELNSKLRDLDIAISRLKPAPPPPKAEDEADEKAGNAANAESPDKNENTSSSSEAKGGKNGTTASGAKSDKSGTTTSGAKSDKSGTTSSGTTSGKNGTTASGTASGKSGTTASGAKGDKPATSGGTSTSGAASGKTEKPLPPPPKDDKTVKPVKE